MAMTIDGKTGWLYIGGVANAKEEVHNSANPLLRQFYVDWKTDTKPQEQCTGKWTAAGPDTTANFTATGYFFARELQRRLQIPIGIINASFGGSSVEGWTSREALAKEGDAEFVAKMNKLMDDYDNHDRLVTNYVAALAAWETKLHAYSGASGITGGAFAVVPYNPKFQAVPLAGEWLCRAEKVFAPLPRDADPMPVAPVKGVLHWMPVPSQYNAMLHPLIPFAIKGVAWYQGESNVGNPRYPKHLKILINDWRRRWGLGDLPFYLCQLPGFGPRTNAPVESAWAECREAQAAALELPNTGIANLIDTCEDGDLHPLNKQDAGRRLALVALANTYGFKDLAWSGPVFDVMKIENGKAIITFQHAADGLVARPMPAKYHPNLRKWELPPKPLELPSPGSELQGFTICDATRRWVNAQAKIEGSAVRVWSDKVPSPVAVRYGWADHPVCNLFNKAGLPAFPFRTDDFPPIKAAKK